MRFDISSKIRLVSVLALVSAIISSNAVIAGDDSNSGQDYYMTLSCDRLWYERNAIYARAGYCFKSKRAQITFPNSCFSPFGKLPSNLKRVVNQIKSIERRRGCR